MKPLAMLVAAALALAAFALADLADAKRLSGSRNIGVQRTTPPPAATSTPGAATNPVMPAQPGATKAPTPAPAAAPSSGVSRWLGPIAGLAAGLGLAALLSHFGLSEEVASLLLIALVVVGAMVAIRMLLARRIATATQGAARSAPLHFEGTPAAASRGGARIEPVIPAPPRASPPPDSTRRFPPEFDREAFVRQAKQQFVRLQAAYDARDRSALSDVLTPQMISEVGRELDARPPQVATEVVALDAEVVDVTTSADAYWVSVRFTGQVREDGAAATSALDEIWHVTKPVDGSSGWRLGGIQQTA